jgi:hypothetical protein
VNVTSKLQRRYYNTYNTYNSFTYEQHSPASYPVIQLAGFLSTVLSKVIYKENQL